jgi:chloramphenicol-sensitive protein RarD
VISRGALTAAAAFLLWGVVPIYWKQLENVSASELTAHRIVWSILFLLGVVAWRKAFGELRRAFTERRVFSYNLLASGLLAINWTVYVWAVNNGHIIECSLGYFLTPLGNVILGSLFLHERLRRLQWVSIALAATGVAFLLLRAGHVPWIALTLAISWSLYGMLKKQSHLGPIPGLTAETLVLFPVAAVYLIWRMHTGEGALGHVSVWEHALILAMGMVTSVPLLMFAYGVQRIRLVTTGLLQYIAPSVQFLVGLHLYHEPFETARLQAFAFIWCGLVLYTADGFWEQRGKLRLAG